ncbi:MAG: class I SAM-dependent methyltransferase [Rhodospirillaceae bacterium]|nr:class I SAM-dependent methyltransferase [Rhodospirillaceae bacterium]
MRFNRRKVLTATAAAAAASLPALKAFARTFPGDVELRGTVGRLERLADMDLENREYFLTTYRTWVSRDLWGRAAARAQAVLKENDIGPGDDVSMAQAVALFENDPAITLAAHTWLRGQQIMWRELVDEFHSNADRYLSEMEAADKLGPALELSPGMFIPDYAKHEIHMQPGGYVGDPFAGHIYYYGTHNFYMGENYQDDQHVRYAAAVPLPADRKVKRVLELGCGCGQMATALKDRFPEAEVWGVDVGGPMVRFAHMRALDIGVDVKFRQALAEDTKLPDGHFDIVTSYILNHEVPAAASAAITAEAHRVLRAGGVYYPIDTHTRRPIAKRTAFGWFQQWWIYRWNQEVWQLEYANFDHVGAMAAAGFAVDENGPPSWPGFKSNILGTKTV